MADVDKLFSEFVAEHQSGGEADPRRFLAQLDDTDRPELAALIDGYLVRSPGQSWDAAQFEGSPAERWTEAMGRSLAGGSGLWPLLLPRLRERAKVKRRELVVRLAEALGAADRTEKVEGYYHQMEQGQLDPRGVSTRVLEALAAIVGSSAEALRSAGDQLGSGGTTPEGTVFARKAIPDADYQASPGLPQEPAAQAARPAEKSDEDEVDRLFTGGD